MWVVAQKSFFGYAGSISMVIAENQVFDLPDGTDWVEAGLVVPLTPPVSAAPEQTGELEPVSETEVVTGPELAAVGPTESTVLPTAKAKKAV